MSTKSHIAVPDNRTTVFSRRILGALTAHWHFSKVFAGMFVVLALGIAYIVVKSNAREDSKIYDAELIEENDTSKTT